MKFKVKEMPQEYSSKQTCHNHWQLPQLFKLASFKAGTTCLDYGGGAFDTSIEYLQKFGVAAQVYDPFNRTKEHNEEVIKWVNEIDGVDYLTCSNVLNVIKEEEVRKNVLINIWNLGKNGATVYFVIYEGNRSGIGKESTKGWQNNRRAAQYLYEIREVFPDVKKKGDLIVAHIQKNS